MRTAMLLLLALSGLTGCGSQTVRGPEGTALKISEPADELMRRGDNGRVQVWIERTGFAGKIKVRVENLPPGVSVRNESLEISEFEDRITLLLHADFDAQLVNDWPVKVFATSENGIEVSESFDVTVHNRQIR